MSHFSRIKNPDLPYLSIAAALRAYILRPASLDVSATLGTTASFSSLLRLGFTMSQLCLANYLLYFIAITCFLYLDHPLYTISCINHYYIRHASFPP